MTSNTKVYLAFFYPWSNEDNKKFIDTLQEKVRLDSNIYFYRTSIIKTLEGRPVEFLVISSTKNMLNKEEKIDD